jgi:hypothetical protein
MTTEIKMTERAEMLMNNNLEWYVVTLCSGKHELMHQTNLSSILQCGEPMSDFGYTALERCWNGEDLSTEDDWI